MAVGICIRCGNSDRYKDGKCKICSRKFAVTRYYLDPEKCKKNALEWKKNNRSRARLLTRKSCRKGWMPGEHEKAELSLATAKYCEVCKGTNPHNKKGWNADHDHKTGLFRGIVCHPCNIAISHVEKFGINRGQQIQSYLDKNSSHENN